MGKEDFGSIQYKVQCILLWVIAVLNVPPNQPVQFPLVVLEVIIRESLLDDLRKLFKLLCLADQRVMVDLIAIECQ